ncbi:MAG: hypothetical protein Q9190_000517 [Brigantiaea leucoxantha]
MVDSLPNINFGFDDLRDRMARFTDRFDEFIAKGRRRVLEERNQFRIHVAELQEDQRTKKREIELLAQKTSSHAQSVTKEVAETAEMQATIAEITRQRDARAEHRDHVRAEIAATKKQISQRLAAQQQHAKALDAQARFNEPELNFWQSHLCLRIEGAGMADRLKFVFTHVDERDWEREAWFELDTEKRDYRVVSVRPKVESEDVERCVERLNENRELGIFLKGMRELLVKALK